MSHSCDVKNISRCRIDRDFFIHLFGFIAFFFCIVSLFGMRRKSPVAVALSALQFCVHILFFDNCTYLKVKREKYPSEIYIFCSLILFHCSLKNKSLWEHVGMFYLTFNPNIRSILAHISDCHVYPRPLEGGGQVSHLYNE